MFGVIDPAIQYIVTQVYDQPNRPQTGQNLTPCFRYVPVGYPDTSARPRRNATGSYVEGGTSRNPAGQLTSKQR